MSQVTIKFLHTSDWHLGAKLNCWPDEAKQKRQREQIEAIKEILQTAEREKVILLLLAGDIFDKDDSFAEEAFEEIKSDLHKLSEKGVQIISVAGSKGHDAKSCLFKQIPGERVIGSEPQEFFLSGKQGGVVALAGGEDALSAKNIEKLRTLRAKFKDAPAILLYHGDFKHLPKPLDFTYTALGHSHCLQRLLDGKAFYSGSPCARSVACESGKNDAGSRYFLIGEISHKGDVWIKPHKLRPLHVLVNVCGDGSELVIYTEADNYVSETGKKSMPLHIDLNAGTIREKLNEVLPVIKDWTFVTVYMKSSHGKNDRYYDRYIKEIKKIKETGLPGLPEIRFFSPSPNRPNVIIAYR